MQSLGFFVSTAAGGSLGIRLLAAAMAQDAGPRDERRKNTTRYFYL